MRLEATVPDSRGSAVQELAEELGLSRSQIIDEALSLFIKAVLEIRRGRRLVTLDPGNAEAACELVTPTLAALEWALKPEKLVLPEAALAKMEEMVAAPAGPSKRLRSAAKQHRR
jgi:predicted transcriptional regulator